MHDPLTRSFQAELSRSPVLVDQSAEDLMASDRGVDAGYGDRIMVGRVLVEALMRSVVIEMAHILVNDCAGVSLVVTQQPVGALLADAANEPFGIAVRPRCLERNLDHIEAFGGEDGTDLGHSPRSE
jgi:hypothetical protein